jgi:hypothetical protein
MPRLEERDAVIATLRPLVAKGWRVDALYSFGNRNPKWRAVSTCGHKTI